MISSRQAWRKHKVVKFLASLKLTTACLLILFMLTFWGTVAQVQTGLYQSRLKYFHSFYFLIAGIFPFPGGMLVMGVLFVNLLAVSATRFVYRWRKAGIIIIHFGLLLFLVSGYVSLRFSTESYLPLKEGETKNISQSAHQWELALWPAGTGAAREVVAIDERFFRDSKSISVDDFGLEIAARMYHPNVDPVIGDLNRSTLTNVPGIVNLRPKEPEYDPQDNIPGGTFVLKTERGEEREVLLYGAGEKPVRFLLDGQAFEVVLRRRSFPLPVAIKLVDFIKEDHPGTDMPRSFKSLVEIQVGDGWRSKTISMNNPLRYRDYTFYQSSYQIDPRGREVSVFSVVKNAGRFLPYAATGITFAGLLIHFIIEAMKNRKK